MASTRIGEAIPASTSGTSPRRAPGAILTIRWGFHSDSIELERGPADTDQHRLVFGGSQLLTAGIQIAAVVAAGSGRPTPALAGADLNGMASCSPIGRGPMSTIRRAV